MKKYLAGSILIGICFLASCVSTQKKMTSVSEMEKQGVERLGSVSATFTSWQAFHTSSGTVKRAEAVLMEEARKQFTGNFEIVNISVTGSVAVGQVFLSIFYPSLLFGNFQKITASGDVVIIRNQSAAGISMQKKLTDAIANASLMMTERLAQNSTIAVLSVYSSDRNTSEYIIGELEYNFVNSGKFKIVDRRRLDQIRSEQNFQLSGDVNDDSAVSIGNMLGASIVITGEVTGTGPAQRLVLKALDVKTAQIVTMAREQL